MDNPNLPMLMVGVLYDYDRADYEKASKRDFLVQVKKQYSLVRGNIIPNSVNESDILIFEIMEPGEVPKASFRGFLYKDNTAMGKLKWINGSEWNLKGRFKYISQDLFVIHGLWDVGGTIFNAFYIELEKK